MGPSSTSSGEEPIRILIATASTGAGHNSVASSLAQALRELGGHRVQVTSVDLLAGGNANWASAPWRLYAPIIVNSPRLWGPVYRISNNAGFFRLMGGLGGDAGMGGLLEAQRPHVVVCVHPLGNQAAALALRRTGWPASLITVITDLAEAHAAWIAPDVSLYAAPTEEVRAGLLARGIAPDRIAVVGVPLDRRFSVNGVDPGRVRREMGLAEDVLTLVLAGGGEGAGDIYAAAQAVSAARLPVQLIAACGHNERLRRKFQRSALSQPHIVLGFTDNMNEVMEAADVVVGKAGALTIAEAVATGKPMVILSALPGQEEANAGFVTRHRLGLRVPNVSALVKTLETWIADPDQMASLVAGARDYRRSWTQAADRAAAAILSHGRMMNDQHF